MDCLVILVVVLPDIFSMNGKITNENPVNHICGLGKVKMGVLIHLRIWTLIPSVTSE